MGCGASVHGQAPGKGKLADDIPEVPSAQLIFKAQFDEWWPVASQQLRERIMSKYFVDDERWAKCFTGYITKGLAAARWEHLDSHRAQSVLTKEDYVKEYSTKIVGRSDLAADNLYKISVDANEYLEPCVKEAAGNPLLAKMLSALLEKRGALSWSQGGFGPQVYTASFLQSYANAMLSDSLFTQPANKYATTHHGDDRPLECGIFFIRPGVEYPLHYHNELEAYYILGGKTRFVWLLDEELVYMDRSQGEWHFNPPNTPHAITTPHGTPHLSLWFREGGPGQAVNNKFGPKWIGDVDGLHIHSEDDKDPTDDPVVKDSEADPGALGFAAGSVFRKDNKKFLRLLTPTQFEYLHSNEFAVAEADSFLTPNKKEVLSFVLEGLKLTSKMHMRNGSKSRQLDLA